MLLYVVSETIDPSNSGSRVRARGIRSGLETLGAVSVAALDEVGRRDSWGAMCRLMVSRRASHGKRLADRVRATFKGSPALLERAIAAGAERAFEELLIAKRPKLVVLSRPCFGPFIDLARRHGARVIVDADESLVRAMGSIAASKASRYQRIRALLDGLNARRFERREYRRVDQVWVSSAVEGRYFKDLLPEAEVREIPNLAPGPRSPDVGDRPVSAISFVGTFSYAPNEEAALELVRSIVPAVRAAGLDLPLFLIGRDPTAAMLREVARLPNVVITGLVDDPIALVRECGVAVIPIRSGAGSRIKILEAMTAGVPVVSTAKGFEGLDVQPNIELLVAETPAEFAAAIRRVRDDAHLRRRLTRAAAGFVQTHHDQAVITVAVGSAARAALRRWGGALESAPPSGI